MSEAADRVPTWIGKVVETSEFSAYGVPVEEASRSRNATASIETDDVSVSPGGGEAEPATVGLARYEPVRTGSRRRAVALFGASAAVVAGLALVALNNRPSTSLDLNIDGTMSTHGTAVTLGEGQSLDVSGQLGRSDEVDVTSPDPGSSSSDASKSPSTPSLELYREEAIARARYAFGVFASGRLHIMGTWADQESAEALGDRASVLVGSQNVVYDVDVAPGAGASPVLFIDRPLAFADGDQALDPSSALLLETAGALMAIYPDARLTVIVPGLEMASNEPEVMQAVDRVDALVASMERLGLPSDRISVEASAAVQDGSVPPFAMLSGGSFDS